MTIIIDGRPVIYPDDLPVSRVKPNPRALPPDQPIPEAREVAPHVYTPRGKRAARWLRVRAALISRPSTHIALRMAGGDGHRMDADTIADWVRHGLLEAQADGLYRITQAGRACVPVVARKK